MRSIRYLNGVLSIIAVLLTLNLWTLWTGGAATLSVATPAQAAPASNSTQTGIPNAGAQRVEMIDGLRDMTRKMDELVALFKSGQARVRVEGAKAEKANN